MFWENYFEKQHKAIEALIEEIPDYGYGWAALVRAELIRIWLVCLV